ncbi:Exportin-4 [Rhizophlyctis rosea]|uniref:Exportin-4 n=1 Tax=Rhizophlyctis rosea TaxID=64517 RepID=A0AAD5S7Q9_9FUNG|nr:Exportin-4 [Rhizophlyctis rosea]
MTFDSRKKADADFDSGDEFCGIVEIAARLLLTNSIPVLGQVPECLPTLEVVARLTDECFRDNLAENDEYTTVAIGTLLQLWADLVGDTEQYLEDLPATNASPEFDLNAYMSFLAKASIHIFDIYMDVRLQLAALQVDEEVEEGEFSDMELYGDQLIYVATLARLDPTNSLKKLQVLLHDLYSKLQAVFKGTGSAPEKDIRVWLEHVHWLSLISGHVLADPGRGEVPFIPPNFTKLPAGSDGQNAIAAVPMSIFGIIDLVSVQPNSAQHAIASPLTLQSLLWFVERWSRTYLLIDEVPLPAHMSAVIQGFSRQHNGAQLLNFLLEKVQQNIVLWHGEEDVLHTVVRLLNTFNETDHIRAALLASEKFDGLLKLLLNNLSNLPASVHSSLIEAIAAIATHAHTPQLRAQYFQGLSDAIQNRFLSVIHRPHFHQTYQNAMVVEEVLSVLEMYSGLALAADQMNSKDVYEVCARRFDDFVKLLDLYRNVEEVETMILQVFNHLVHCQSFDELTVEDCQKLYTAIMSLLQTYAKNEAGRKRSKENEQELHEDLANMLELLAELMASQYEGLGWSDIMEKRAAKAPATIDVGDVVFFGIDTILPMITQKMLQYPDLCKDYIMVVSNLFKYFPDKLSQFGATLFTNLVNSLAFGMDQPIAEVGLVAFEATTSLGLFTWDEGKEKGAAAVAFIAPHADALLRKIMTLMLFQDFDSTLVESAGEALFALSIARRESYATLINELIQAQDVSALRTRLQVAFEKLNRGIEELMRVMEPGGKLQAARVDGSLRGPEVMEWKEAVRQFLVDVRGFLRVK